MSGFLFLIIIAGKNEVGFGLIFALCLKSVIKLTMEVIPEIGIYAVDCVHP